MSVPFEHWEFPLLFLEPVLEDFSWSTVCWCQVVTSLVPLKIGGVGWDGELIPSSVELQILVFPNLPATVCFSESSNNCSKHSVHVL